MGLSIEMHECDGLALLLALYLAIALWNSLLSRHELPKERCLLSYDLRIRALPLLIERAAQVIESIELGRFSGELAGVATC